MAQQKAVEPAVDEVDDLIDELQPGAKLLKGQYTITRYLNSGGFGITYLAKDSLDRDVVIKECFPSSVCRRSKAVVAARSRAHTAELRSIVQLFVREAHHLAKIVHPNIVAVHQVFEDYGTAYMAIDYIDGLDLQQIIDGEGPPLTPGQIISLTGKLLNAVGFIHENDMLHRDISPDNVLINKSGDPILIDFGAARDKASQSNRAMSALRVVKDGYSPQEFYIAGSEQGPWSDLYALAATIYHLIAGEAPVNGQARLGALAEDRADPYVPLAGRFPEYPDSFLQAIDKAMNTLPKQRIQSAADWLAMINETSSSSVAGGADAAVHQLPVKGQFGAASDQTAPGAESATQPPAKAPSRPSNLSAQQGASNRGKSPVQLLAGVAVALVVVAGAYAFLGGNSPLSTTGSKAIVTGDVTKAAEPASSVAVAPSEVSAKAADPVVETTSETTAAPVVATVDQPATEVATASATESATQPSAATADVAPEAAAPAETEADVASEVEASEVADPAQTASTEVTTQTEATATTEAAAPTEEVALTEGAAPIEETAPVVATAAPVGKPSANQIGFAAWDVELPFTADDRIIGGQSVTIVLSVAPTIDIAEAGNWLQPGLLIYGVNGEATPTSKALTAEILNAMQVDPDGKARLVVEYAGSDLVRKTDLLTVGVVRLVSFANGISVRTSAIDGVWTSEVTGVIDPAITTLRQGDILFRDKTTSIPLDGPMSLETIMTDLIAAGTTETSFSIIRDNKVTDAKMQLVLDGGQ